MASSRPCLVSMLLEVSGPLLKSVVTCAKYMDIIFACTVFQVSSDLQFKSEFSEEIQINELNLLSVQNSVIIVPKWYM
jgi:hypothetical protein